MKINMDDLYPWADINNHFTRMKKMQVKVGDEVLGPDCELEFDAVTGTVTLQFEAPKRTVKAKRFDDVMGAH